MFLHANQSDDSKDSEDALTSMADFAWRKCPADVRLTYLGNGSFELKIETDRDEAATQLVDWMASLMSTLRLEYNVHCSATGKELLRQLSQ